MGIRGSGRVVLEPESLCGADRAFLSERASGALGNPGFADLAAVGDKEDVHIVAVVFGNHVFHDRVCLVGGSFLGDESESF